MMVLNNRSFNLAIYIRLILSLKMANNRQTQTKFLEVTLVEICRIDQQQEQRKNRSKLFMEIKLII